MEMENYSLSDLATAAKGDTFGGGGIMWLILIFLLVFGGGFGNNGIGQYATAASQQELLFGQQFQALDNKIDRIGNGIADATFALNNSVTNEGRNIQMQLAECCCGNKEATAQVRYDMANFASAINSNIDSKFAALEKSQLEQTIAAQQSQINQLALAQQFAGVVRYPMATTYSSGNNPYCMNGF